MDWWVATKASRRGVAARTDTIDGGEVLYYRWMDGVAYCYPEDDPTHRRRCFPKEVDGYDDWEPVPL